MKITNQKIVFLGIIATLLFNIVVVSNFNMLFIGSAYSFLYLSIIPGFFVQRLLRMQRISFFDSIAYIVGFSISYLFLVGISTNLLELLPQMPHPLNESNSLIFFNIYTAILLFINYIRENKSFIIFIILPKVTFIELLFYIIPFFFPILSIIGVELLNSHGVNTLIMALISSIALYVFITSIFVKNLSKFHFEIPLYLIAISLLFMFSLRSSYIIGWDVYQEYRVFWLTESNQLWSMKHFQDAYNACLSITILPTLLHYFTRVSDPFVFKVLLQCTFALTPITIYSLAKRFADHLIAFLSAFLFMITPDFFFGLSSLVRQEIAYLFFGLLLLMLFTKQIAPLQKKILFIIFSFSIVLSHYSTTYILIALFAFSCIFLTIHEKISYKSLEDFTLKPLLVTIFILFAATWLGVITRTSSNIITALYETSANITNFEQHTLNTSILDQLFPTTEDRQALLAQEIHNGSIEYRHYHFTYYPKSTYKDYTPTIVEKEILPLHIPAQISNIIYSIGSFIKIMVKLLIILGFATVAILHRKKFFPIEYSILSLGFAIALIIITSVPEISLFYPAGRLNQQTLFLIAFPTILSISWILQFITFRFRIAFITTFLIIFFLFTTTFFSQIIGGKAPEIILNNSGLYYNEVYPHASEIASIHWLDANNKKQLPVFADIGSKEKINGYSDNRYIAAYIHVFPSLVDTNGYVYSNYANTLYGIGITNPKDTRMEYNFPNEFLNNNKDLIYSNYYTRIYK